MANLAHLMQRQTFDRIEPLFRLMQDGQMELDAAQDQFKEILATDATVQSPAWLAFYIRTVARSVVYLPEIPTVFHESKDARLTTMGRVWS